MSKFFALIRNSLGMASPATAKVAKERLSIMLVQQRSSELFNGINIDDLQKEVYAVLNKHIKMAENKPAHISSKTFGHMCMIIFYNYSCM